MEPLPLTAAAIAKQRFEKYLAEKLYGSFDLTVWEFYTFLLEQAKKHHIDTRGTALLLIKKTKYRRGKTVSLPCPVALLLHPSKKV
ncbi:MAG: hypothetical protein LBG93_01310 [Treponema sp.]|jgi:hypothetical protein|nr:hypothetical protein [Treponema sp.]